MVALSGPLGSGKTTFVRAVVTALHGSDETSSPTFTFWHRYDGEPPIDHVDLFGSDYRNAFFAAIPEPAGTGLLLLLTIPLFARRRASARYRQNATFIDS